MSLRTPIAYGAVAGFCIFLHNMVLVVSDAAGWPLWLSIPVSFAIVSTAGYILHGLITFRTRLQFRAFGLYALAMSANIPLAFITTWFWQSVAGLPMALAAPLASAFMIFVNFAMGRWAIRARNPSVEVE